MRLKEILNKPEYVFRPKQVFLRIWRVWIKGHNEFERVLLPWGVEIDIRPREAIGTFIWRTGIFDLTVSEVLWRLIEPGECAVDVGANIGYMTSIMAVRVGEKGRVISFEPHPEIYKELIGNVENWKKAKGIGPITVLNRACSAHSFQGRLMERADFNENRGTALLVSENVKTEGRTYDVSLTSLDEALGEGTNVGVLKIDVEGHELQVLEGASQLIRGKRIRDIVFEEKTNPPTPVTRLLEQNGFTIFNLSHNLFSLEVGLMNKKPAKKIRWETPSYLATTEPSRALTRLKEKGWHIFK